MLGRTVPVQELRLLGVSSTREDCGEKSRMRKRARSLDEVARAHTALGG
jgi:hypothetical protein